MSVGSNRGTAAARITHIRQSARKRREDAIEEEREDSDDKEEINSDWTTLDQDGFQVMSSSDEDYEETEDKEDIPEPSDVPDL